MNTVLCYDLGRSPYQETWDLQKAIQSELIDYKLAIRNGNLAGTPPKDVLLLVEHPHVYTLGKSGSEDHLLKSNEELSELDATYVKIDRGGDITYHGPGQIVGYPIMDLDRYFTDIHKYLRFLEEVIIRTCADYGITAGRIEKLTGVWVGDSKICAFGIKCTRWVTLHGFALNVNAHLEYFGNIIPCGISDKQVCSLSSLLGRKVDVDEVKERIKQHFEQLFEVEIETQTDSKLGLFEKYGVHANVV
jgi:lipoyl(octanoyl) transferase